MADVGGSSRHGCLLPVARDTLRPSPGWEAVLQMTLMLALWLTQAVVSVPAYSPPGALPPPADTGRLSVVVATTVSETDPQALCDRPNCTSLFLGRYRDARTLAGPPVDPEFSARVEMGSPWNMSYRLVLIVEERPDQERLVRAMAGFNQRTGQACFERREIAALDWTPEGAGLSRTNGTLCVTE